MKIYTKTGDAGQTRLVGGDRIDKSDPRLEAYGEIDELNSVLGVLQNYVHQELKSDIYWIQNFLFNLGSHLATVDTKWKKSLPSLDESKITILETRIDELDHRLAPLRHFILPGGTQGASYLHLARTVCRRCERSVVLLKNLNSEAFVAASTNDDPENEFHFPIKFLNRLSDFLFVAARYDNHLANIPDQTWKQDI